MILKIVSADDGCALYDIIFNNNKVGVGKLNFKIDNNIELNIYEKNRGYNFGSMAFVLLIQKLKEKNFESVSVKFENHNTIMEKIVIKNDFLHITTCNGYKLYRKRI